MKLAVSVDGAAMPDADARAFWERFSAWMEEHQGDLAGFAAREGFASVHPGVEAGVPTLRVSRSTPQGAYLPVRARAGGGSDGRHERPNRPDGSRKKTNPSKHKTPR